MSTNQLPNSTINRLGEGDPNLTQSTPRFSTTASGPSLLDTRGAITDRAFTSYSFPDGIIPTSIDDTHGRDRLGIASNPGTMTPGATGTRASGVEEGGPFDENVLVPIPDGESEPFGTTDAPDFHFDFQESDIFYEDNRNPSGDGRGSPQLMWYEGEEYYEELFDYHRPRDLSMVSTINLINPVHS